MIFSWEFVTIFVERWKICWPWINYDAVQGWIGFEIKVIRDVFCWKKISDKSSQKDTLNIYTKREWTVAKQPTHRDILFARYYFLVHKGISITIFPKFIHWYTTWAEISWATIKSNNIKALEPQKCFRIIDDSTPDWNSIRVRTQQRNVDAPLVRINCTPFFSSIPLD